MDDGRNYRGWDLWLENGKVGAHLVNEWPGKAIKVVAAGAVPPGVWTHIFATYDGSGRASGLKLYVNGLPQTTETEVDTLTRSIRTEVPLKIGQRNTASRLEQAMIHSVRIYDRALRRVRPRNSPAPAVPRHSCEFRPSSARKKSKRGSSPGGAR